MLFSVQADTGSAITGYLVPDSHSARTSVVVSSDGVELLRMETAESRDALVQAGRHDTGLCGFTVDEGVVPGLAGLADVELREAESGILIYRRCPPEAVLEKKLFRLETNLLPLAKLDRAIRPAFRFHYPSIDRHGLETTQQIFLLENHGSLYASGRVTLRSYEGYLEKGYASIALIQEPFDELAERILVLRLIGQGFSSFLGPRDASLFETAVALATELPIDGSPKDMRRALRGMPESAANALSNPLARQLTTRSPGEQLTRTAVSASLTALASFELIGLRDRADAFVETLADMLAIETDALPALEPIGAVKQLGQLLRQCPPAELLLEHDLALYEQVRGAFKKSGIEP
ncbi:hypothetical protein [Enterovirga sp.]|jgi:hypothetical protein|uniref:hypothetical protein n=1 Tax=Enterovirga sp. TaxID=2026350 RepID=UPI00262250D1|nr:hypothetical protein [Enterovirga sp.]MDB5590867.1 uncharacterized protein [Enterovirga sp.]